MLQQRDKWGGRARERTRETDSKREEGEGGTKTGNNKDREDIVGS